ncbi:hypothetical protein [Gluconobacter kondonii]|uniref:hypothetical protein n=1 Tax=Gluconobacter kondonii TaxID=941463 RepID=UPI001B8CD2C2|nr:hypothetical protein [Gluconobacter kondonii]MBS1083152.1 hypothetical protein [Gluconobacter kondonii]
MIEKTKETIKKYPIWCCLFSVALGFIIYGIDIFLSECSKDVILKAVPTAILGAITAYIAYQQHIIAKSQKEIAEDKHRLELFEKRFETYELFLDMALQAHKLSSDRRVYESPEVEGEFRKKNSEYLNFLRKNESKMISLGEGALFLFSSDVKDFLGVARGNIINKRVFVENINELRKKKGPASTFVEEITERDPSEKVPEDLIRQYDKFLPEFYEKKLPEIMGPYLKMTPYLSKD